MSGEMRRPPQLWEQRLARTTSVLAAGVGGGEATAIVAPSPPPGDGGGVEPAPVTPPPGDFIAPSQPTLISSVQGINVVWNGLNSAGDLWPSDTSYVEVHMDTSGTATLGTATLKGRLARPGGLAVTGLSAGTTYYFRLRGADPAGNVTAASTAASGQPGLINAPDIAANAITANSIVAGTITGWDINAAYLSGGTISGGFITGGTVSGGFISGGTIDGSSLRTASSGTRIELGTALLGASGLINFYGPSSLQGQIFNNATFGGLTISGGNSTVGIRNDRVVFDTEIDCDSLIVNGTALADTMRPTGNLIVFQGYRQTTTAGDVIMRLSSDVTSANQAKFEVDADGDVKSRTNSYAGFSDARYKDNITPARDYLDDLREVEVVTFNWQGSDQKLLGVTAQQIQPIFPNMVAEDEDGTLSVRYSVFVPMLLTAVQSLADQVDDLRSRIEALEA
jgi:hypothetical protein